MSIFFFIFSLFSLRKTPALYGQTAPGIFLFMDISDIDSVVIFGRQPFLIQMCLRRMGQYLGNGETVILPEFDHRNTGVTDVKMGAKHRIRNIQHATQKCQTKTLMGKKCHALVIGFFNAVFSGIGYMLLAQIFKKRICFPANARHPLRIRICRKFGMLIPVLAQVANFFGMK